MTTMIETMIERVAAFLKVRDENVMPHETSDDERRGSAIAILEEMREPTEGMVSAMIWQVNDWQNERGTDQDVWYAPIDAALKEESR